MSDAIKNAIGTTITINEDTAPELFIFAASLGLIAFSIYYIISSKNDPKAQTSNFITYIIIALIPLILAMVFIQPLYDYIKDATSMLYSASVVFLFLIGIYLFYRIINPQAVSNITLILWYVGILLILIALAIVFRIFSRVIENWPGFTGIVLRIIFYIPCLLIELFETLFSELKSAPKMVIFLFVLEVAILLLYFYYPTIIQKMYYSSDATTLVNQPIFLTKSVVVPIDEKVIAAKTEGAMAKPEPNVN
jgi:hypothetical protein